jgi:hypothetical protein
MSQPRKRTMARSRRDAPLWRQAAEGIGLVIVFAGIVALVGAVLAFIVSLLF